MRSTARCAVTVLALALFAGWGTPAAGQDAKLSVEGLTKRETVLLITGMAYGMGTANFFARMEGRGLYCQPREVLTDGQLIWDLVAAELKGPHKPDAIAIAAVDALRRKYPCR